jgi:hypothetical protein
MKNPDRKTASRLEDLPNIGKAMAGDLRLIGIDHPKKLIGKDPFKLYDTLCRATGTKQDPCVIDVFISVVHFMEGGQSLPWWHFTDKRKNNSCLKDVGRNITGG